MSSINQHLPQSDMDEEEIFLLFEIDGMTYATDCDNIKEITPLVMLKTVSDMGDTFAGVFNYRGQVVSVVDLCRLLVGRPCRTRLSTRIILTEYTPADGASCILGFMTEGVTEIIRQKRSDFLSANMISNLSPHKGGILMKNGRIIRYIDMKTLPASLNVTPMVKNADVLETS